jgi:hypothetical protein
MGLLSLGFIVLISMALIVARRYLSSQKASDSPYYLGNAFVFQI